MHAFGAQMCTCRDQICPEHAYDPYPVDRDMVSGGEGGNSLWPAKKWKLVGGLCSVQHQRLHPPASSSHDFLSREGYCSFHGRALLLVAITSTNRFVQIPAAWKSCSKRPGSSWLFERWAMRFETWCDLCAMRCEGLWAAGGRCESVRREGWGLGEPGQAGVKSTGIGLSGIVILGPSKDKLSIAAT